MQNLDSGNQDCWTQQRLSILDLNNTATECYYLWQNLTQYSKTRARAAHITSTGACKEPNVLTLDHAISPIWLVRDNLVVAQRSEDHFLKELYRQYRPSPALQDMFADFQLWRNEAENSTSYKPTTEPSNKDTLRHAGSCVGWHHATMVHFPYCFPGLNAATDRKLLKNVTSTYFKLFKDQKPADVFGTVVIRRWVNRPQVQAFCWRYWSWTKRTSMPVICNL